MHERGEVSIFTFRELKKLFSYRNRIWKLTIPVNDINSGRVQRTGISGQAGCALLWDKL